MRLCVAGPARRAAMSTQDQPGVPFAQAHAQQSFRLLELPDALLELLTSQNPPV